MIIKCCFIVTFRIYRSIFAVIVAKFTFTSGNEILYVHLTQIMMRCLIRAGIGVRGKKKIRINYTKKLCIIVTIL